MQKWLASVVILTLAFVAIGHAQRGRGAGGPPPPPSPVAGNGVEVPGWWGRVDDVKETNDGVEVRPDERRAPCDDRSQHHLLGSAADGDGQLHRQGHFHRRPSQPSHAVSPTGCSSVDENLDGDKQKYSYFLIRENGQFLIKKRNGTATSNVAGDWAANPAITAIAGGAQKNELSIQVARRTRQLHGQREGSRQPSGNRDRHQRRRRPSRRSRDGYSDRRLRGRGAEVTIPVRVRSAPA